MSCFPCCCVATKEKLQGAWARRGRHAARLLGVEAGSEEEAEVQSEEEEKVMRNDMDISVLREQYRSTRESQKRRTQVLLFRRVSQELSDTLSIVPVSQGLTLPEHGDQPPVQISHPTMLTPDPWHVHLGLHRRSCPQAPGCASIDVTRANSHRGCPSSASGISSTDQIRCGDPLAASLSRNTETSTSPSSHLHHPTADSVCDSFNAHAQITLEGSHKNPGDFSEEDNFDDSVRTSRVCSFSSSVSGSHECSAAGSLTSSDEGSFPVVSVTNPPKSSIADVDKQRKKKTQSVSASEDTNDSVWRDSQRSSNPVLGRQVSFGGFSLSQHQHYYPFPQRKSQRISEAARRLGMYSSL